jgi:hypothetical protein
MRRTPWSSIAEPIETRLRRRPGPLLAAGVLHLCFVAPLASRTTLSPPEHHQPVATATNAARLQTAASYELAGVKMEVSLLAQPRNVRELDSIDIGRHGLLVSLGLSSCILLPHVAR